MGFFDWLFGKQEEPQEQAKEIPAEKKIQPKEIPVIIEPPKADFYALEIKDIAIDSNYEYIGPLKGEGWEQSGGIGISIWGLQSIEKIWLNNANGSSRKTAARRLSEGDPLYFFWDKTKTNKYDDEAIAVFTLKRGKISPDNQIGFVETGLAWECIEAYLSGTRSGAEVAEIFKGTKNPDYLDVKITEIHHFIKWDGVYSLSKEEAEAATAIKKREREERKAHEARRKRKLKEIRTRKSKKIQQEP